MGCCHSVVTPPPTENEFALRPVRGILQFQIHKEEKEKTEHGPQVHTIVYSKDTIIWFIHSRLRTVLPILNNRIISIFVNERIGTLFVVYDCNKIQCLDIQHVLDTGSVGDLIWAISFSHTILSYRPLWSGFLILHSNALLYLKQTSSGWKANVLDRPSNSNDVFTALDVFTCSKTQTTVIATGRIINKKPYIQFQLFASDVDALSTNNEQRPCRFETKSRVVHIECLDLNQAIFGTEYE